MRLSKFFNANKKNIKSQKNKGPLEPHFYKTMDKNSFALCVFGFVKNSFESSSSAMTPLSIKRTLLDTSLAKPISWVTTSIVRPSSAKSLITFRTSLTISGSRADVGSSKSRTSGFMASDLAIATLCFCPPDRDIGLASLKGYIPTFSRNLSAILTASSRDLFRTLTCPMTQFSRTVILLKRLKDWKTIPTLVL